MFVESIKRSLARLTVQSTRVDGLQRRIDCGKMALFQVPQISIVVVCLILLSLLRCLLRHQSRKHDHVASSTTQQRCSAVSSGERFSGRRPAGP